MNDLRTRLKSFTLQALGYTFGALFLLVGGISLVDGGLYSGLAALTLGAILLPPVTAVTIRRLPPAYHLVMKVVLVVTLFGVIGATASVDERRASERAEVREQAEIAAEFEEDRQAILDSLDVLIAEAPTTAVAYGDRYAFLEDADLVERLDMAKTLVQAERDAERERQLVEQARSVPASETARNAAIYEELHTLDPDNALYEQKLAHYSAIRDREREAEAQRRAAVEAKARRMGPRPEQSSWDGTYREVKDYLKAVARDPGSIKVESCTNPAELEREEAWLVGCRWQGRNGFGGMNRSENWFLIKQGRVTRMAEPSEYRIN